MISRSIIESVLQGSVSVPSLNTETTSYLPLEPGTALAQDDDERTREQDIRRSCRPETRRDEPLTQPSQYSVAPGSRPWTAHRLPVELIEAVHDVPAAQFLSRDSLHARRVTSPLHSAS